MSSPVQLNIRRGYPTDRKVEMDVLSNKEVNIGLELLMNTDKKKPVDAASPRAGEYSGIQRDDEDDNRRLDLNNYDDDDLKFENIVGKGSSSSEDLHSNRSQKMEHLFNKLNLPTSESPRVSPLADLDHSKHGDSGSSDYGDYDHHDYRRSSEGDDDRREERREDRREEEYDRRSRSEYHVQSNRMSYEEEKEAKEKILYELEKMRRLGVSGIKRFNMSSDLEEMQYELNKIKKEREIEGSIKFQRKVLMAFVTGVELINSKFNYFNVHLDGWSETIHENQNDYDEIFEELHEKYAVKTKMAPELRLVFALAGSAFMHHLTNSMFKTSMPGIGDILKQNPNLMNDVMKAATNQMPFPEQRQAANIFGQFAQMAGGGQRQAPRPAAPQAASAEDSDDDIPAYEPRPETVKRPVSTPAPTAAKKKSIPPPMGVEDVLNDLKSTTSASDSISEIISQSERRPRKTLFQKPKMDKNSANSTLSL
jgi:hypothetical protein